MSLRYRLATSKDAELLTENRNKHRACFFDSSKLTVEQTRTWIEGSLNNQRDYMFIIEESVDILGPGGSEKLTSPVGQFSVYNIIRGDRAECGRLIQYTPHEMFKFRCLDIMHDMSTLHSLQTMVAEVHAWNKKSLIFFAKMGFVTVKIEREGSNAIFTLVRRMK